MDDVLANEVAAAYAIGAIRDCTRHDRDTSSVARIDTAERVYWLKVFTLTNPALDDLESEAEVANALAERGIAVARAIRRSDGQYAGKLALAGGAVAALLFAEAPGELVVAPTLAQAEALGMLLARFHATVVERAGRRWRIDAEALARAPLRSLSAWRERTGGEVTRDAARASDKLASIAAEMDCDSHCHEPGCDRQHRAPASRALDSALATALPEMHEAVLTTSPCHDPRFGSRARDALQVRDSNGSRPKRRRNKSRSGGALRVLDPDQDHGRAV